MSVENKNVIDIVSIDKDGFVVLTITDHLEWDDSNEHFIILQEKINAYLAAIETGEFYNSYPKAIVRSIIIEIVALYSPNKDGFIFLEHAKNILKKTGYGLHFLVKDQS